VLTTPKPPPHFSCNRVVSFNCRQESVLVVATQVVLERLDKGENA
jgi:hypothetical protein